MLNDIPIGYCYIAMSTQKCAHTFKPYPNLSDRWVVCYSELKADSCKISIRVGMGWAKLKTCLKLGGLLRYVIQRALIKILTVILLV